MVFIGAEYVIGNSLVAVEKMGRDCISFRNLRYIGMKFQDYCNENNIYAIVRVYGDYISRALHEYADYFDYVESGDPLNEPMVRIKKGKTVSSLKQRFYGYLPLNVIVLLVTEISKIVDELVEQ